MGLTLSEIFIVTLKTTDFPIFEKYTQPNYFIFLRDCIHILMVWKGSRWLYTWIPCSLNPLQSLIKWFFKHICLTVHPYIFPLLHFPELRHLPITLLLSVIHHLPFLIDLLIDLINFLKFPNMYLIQVRNFIHLRLYLCLIGWKTRLQPTYLSLIIVYHFDQELDLLMNPFVLFPLVSVFV